MFRASCGIGAVREHERIRRDDEASDAGVDHGGRGRRNCVPGASNVSRFSSMALRSLCRIRNHRRPKEGTHPKDEDDDEVN
jgi:hypothetical protein